jgi:polynucleotide 5'-hydroxyl-kinase GRC3/NOL9
MSQANPIDPISPPSTWRRLDLAGLQGTLMILGDSDTGKSTLARYLFLELCRLGRRVAYLDGDVGQSTLGLPATMTVALNFQGSPPAFPPAGSQTAFFVGAVSPRGHMLPVVVGAHKLQTWAQRQGAEAIVMDTTGMIDVGVGGGALKQWKIELLQPTTLFALARGAELEHILWPLRRRKDLRLCELAVAPEVREKARETRIAHRAERFQRYFAGAGLTSVSLNRLPVIGLDGTVRHRLLAFQDEAGFAVGLGVVESSTPRQRTLSVRTPLTSLDGVASIRLGNLKLDPTSGQQII